MSAPLSPGDVVLERRVLRSAATSSAPDAEIEHTARNEETNEGRREDRHPGLAAVKHAPEHLCESNEREDEETHGEAPLPEGCKERAKRERDEERKEEFFGAPRRAEIIHLHPEELLDLRVDLSGRWKPEHARKQ